MSTRFPPINGRGVSMQMANDPQYMEQEEQPGAFLDENEGGFDFNAGNNRSGQEDQSMEVYNSRRRREESSNLGPIRTAGMIKLRDLAAEDISKEPYLGRDAAVTIEGELRQFDQKRFSEKGGQVQIQRYVESLISGNFMKVQKEINLSSQPLSTDTDPLSDKKVVVQSNRELFERELKEVQRLWINRLHKLFYLFLGLLSGMSLMHLIIIMSSNTDVYSFLQLYSKVCISINLVFMIFTSFALILGLAMALIYKNKSEEKMRNMDPYRFEFRQHYLVSLLITLLIALCLGLLYILPHYTNKFFYWNPSNITDKDVQSAKGLYGAVNVIFLVSWLLSSAFNKASITDLDFDPELDDVPEGDDVETQEGNSSVLGE